MTQLTPEAVGEVDAACLAGMRRAFEFLGKRWNGMILASLHPGPMGFSEVRRSVGGITDSVLSDRLNELVHTGLVERTVTDSRPPGVSYQLSPMGLRLVPVLHQLGEWANEHLPEEQCRSSC